MYIIHHRIQFSTIAHYFSIYVIPNDRLEETRNRHAACSVYVICVYNNDGSIFCSVEINTIPILMKLFFIFYSQKEPGTIKVAQLFLGLFHFAM